MKEASWKKKKHLKPQLMLDKINSAKQVSEDGRVSFSVFEYHDAFAAIFSMLDFPATVSTELNTDSLVSKALNESAKSDNITTTLFIETINSIIKKELATKEINYKLLTSISIHGALPFKNIIREDIKIRLISEFPKKYHSRNKTINSINKKLEPHHHNYTKVIVSVKSRSIYGAANKALKELDFIRGVFCLLVNSGMEIMGDPYSPINKIRLGESHTLHLENGKPGTENTLWFDPSFATTDPHTFKNLSQLKKELFWIFKRVDMCSYKQELKESIIRFVRALDDANHDSALIQLWGALEAITAPGQSNYDLVTRRCAFIFKEAQYHQQILEHLREHRNQSVHVGSQSERAKNLCFQLQFYFKQLIFFHLRKTQEFKSLDEANNFLDFPADHDGILALKSKIDRVMKFREIKP